MGLFNLFTRKKNIENHNGFNRNYFCGYLRYEYYRRFNRIHGKHIEYHENGSLKCETEYFDGIRQGHCINYYDNGNKLRDTYYLNDMRNGKTIWFYENGLKAREFDMKNDEIYGEVIEYNKVGTLKFKNEGINYLFFNSRGQKTFSIKFVPHEAVGRWQIFRSDGTLQYNLEFDQDLDSIKETLAKKKLVKKINYNINGDILSTTMQSYNIINSSVYKFLSKYAHYRIIAKEEIEIPPAFQGPGGLKSTFIKNTPIKSIKDIVKLTPI